MRAEALAKVNGRSGTASLSTAATEPIIAAQAGAGGDGGDGGSVKVKIAAAWKITSIPSTR